MKIKTILACLLLLMAVPNFAQTKKTFTLDDLLSGGSNFWNLQPENLHTVWWGDVLVELDADDCRQISDTKGRSVNPKSLFTLEELNRAAGFNDSNKVRSLYYVSFPDGDRTEALVRTSRENLIYDWSGRKIVWRQPRVAGATHADLSLASRHEAYVRNWNLYVMTADGTELAVTTDGSRELVYGQSVHRDEFGISKGTFWSPKGNLLAFYRMDQSMVTDYPQVDITGRPALYAPDKYPMAGMTSHKVTVGIFNPATKQTVYLKAGDPTDRYFTNIAWSPDERTVYMIELPRTQDKAELVAYDAATGDRKGVLYTERNAKYVHPEHPIVFLPWDDTRFIYQSERDGYNHLYLFDTAGHELRQLTQGPFVVTSLVGFNVKKKRLIITSTEASPIQANLYAVDVATGKRVALDGGTGCHTPSLSASGAYVRDLWSSPDVVRKIDLTATATGKSVSLLTAADPWAGYEVPEITCGVLKAADDSTDLYYRLVKPTDFDPNKKYPTVVYV